MRWVGLAMCALLVGEIALAGDKSSEKGGFVPLSDGRSFQGWEGNLKVFRIEDGAICGGSLKRPLEDNEFLCTTKEYGDINGHKRADYTETDPAIPRKGIIGLQIHGGPPSEAWYKDIVIKEL